MPKLVRLLKFQRERGIMKDEELKVNCSRCGKRPATDADGLCSYCRFEGLLSRMIEEK